MNPPVYRAIGDRIAEWVGDVRTVWDLYCGNGGLGLGLAARSKAVSVFGADIDAVAIDLAEPEIETALRWEADRHLHGVALHDGVRCLELAQHRLDH